MQTDGGEGGDGEEKGLGEGPGVIPRFSISGVPCLLHRVDHKVLESVQVRRDLIEIDNVSGPRRMWSYFFVGSRRHVLHTFFLQTVTFL